MYLKKGDKLTIKPEYKLTITDVFLEPEKVYIVHDTFMTLVSLEGLLFVGYFPIDWFELYLVNVVNKNIEKMLT